MTYATIDSPCGPITIVASDQGVRVVSFDVTPQPDWVHDPDMAAASQLRQYFDGTRTVFDLPLDLEGTEFQRTVWEALTTIPYGTTATYGELAARIDRPKASRAVGAANGKNPIAIIVPCHRVIGANGTLTGYAGGLDRKEKLLSLEQPQSQLF